ncbi:MAG: bifunctional tetrahydrofolate synthase/dihydrofolate synthase [Rheinheimera sp.]|uniref:bifunctional tetrahydrofolate synthase/dihydrofolate synthase n=1 Tax=Arsukibacterium sp. UBA3155 TaxID=1946058 RepID=UPI000C937C70|nr:bifunctional tetrahydrofolate synthase/dihydrofolate synthase [Arsukibacterium sp. UBA3155]MAD77234.1 bifunctional tetrahydrofolate synthase/dihydrofolate synthase [Rheinheimera sp.]|tara:strand:+ start:144472 stop:145746 length:1275 start_codon:yes stop_codon:yes gene_type:complete
MPDTLTSSQSCHTLADWLYYIEQSHPIDKIELGLGRVSEVAGRADLAQLPGKVILIAGTNGKGSTARTLEQLLLAQGYRVGVYSSPHLLRFNERLRINAQDVDDDLWVEALSKVEVLRKNIGLTYFEFTTLAAFAILKGQPVDFCLIEVGLGGRLDATNIVSPDISVITTIDLDHQDWLGNDLDSIGFEKAGVFRQDQSVVIGDLQPPQSVLARAAALNCAALRVNQDYFFQQATDSWNWQCGSANYQQLPLPGLPVQNVATSLAVLSQLSLLPEQAELARVLTTLSLSGRMQFLQHQPAIMIDVAHNPQSTRYLADRLAELKPAYNRVIALVGMLKDKDIAQALAPLTSVIDQWHLSSLPGPRGAAASQLAQVLAQTDCQQHPDVASAFNDVRNLLQQDDLLVIFGSFVTVSAVLASYHQEAT